MKTLKKILEKLAGKKATIFAVIALIITFLLNEQIISENVAYLLNSILVLLGGTVNYASYKLNK